MRYLSTRGGLAGIPFREAVMLGLAEDGGLLVPETLPAFSPGELAALKGCSYQETALQVMSRFIDDIPPADLAQLIEQSYRGFDDPLITPLVPVGDLHLLELFHGPTLAFKDVALQFLGALFEYLLAGQDFTLNVLGATSGDTGSAAIAGLRGKAGIKVFILFPEGRVSPLQEKQMTSVLDDNVQCIAIQGSFDDCQALVKASFGDLEFRRRHQLGAVNSVNWARILAQTVYYFHAWTQLGCPPQFQAAVPTGNFGNIFAGFIAQRLGLPLAPLILATNSNDILHRFFQTGRYRRRRVLFTLSPAMDIQVASNFERYLHYLFDGRSSKVRGFMRRFTDTGQAEADVGAATLAAAFKTGCASDAETLQTLRACHQQHGYLADPHTAVALTVAQQARHPDLPLVCLATAHPAKFDQAIKEALGDEVEATHPTLEALRDAPTRKTRLPADRDAVKAFIASHNP